MTPGTPATTGMLSVVIPTKNGADTLPALLDSLKRQQVGLPTEIIVVDSGSTDGTLDIARGRVDRLVTTPADEFDHGLTRNLGIESSRGDLIVLTVQDAVAASGTLLQDLITPLLSDPQAAGSFARQRPRPDSSALTKDYLARWVAASATGRTVEIADATAFDALTPTERLERCAFDNVCSCVRRTVWEAIPFRSTPFAEDLAWAKEVLLAGHRLVYAPGAVVIHSHDRSIGHELSRTRLAHRQLFELFGLRTIPSVPALMRAVLGTLPHHLRLEGVNLTRLPRAVGLAAAWPLGQYLGGLDGVRGRPESQDKDATDSTGTTGEGS